MSWSTAAANAMLNGPGLVPYLGAGAGAAHVSVYSAEGLHLVDIMLDDPCGIVDGGVLTLSASSSSMILASGAAAFAILRAADGSAALDLTVSGAGGAGQLKLSETVLYAGGLVSLLSGELSW